MCVCFVGLATINSFYARETLKDSKKIDIRPEMLEVCVYVCMYVTTRMVQYVAHVSCICFNIMCMQALCSVQTCIVLQETRKHPKDIIIESTTRQYFSIIIVIIIIL